MAPVPPPTPLIQPSLIASPITPAQVTSFIPLKLFFQLLAGTACIFILTVLIWKVPRFLRSFTKARILREGNTPSARYAKTWYGWVSSHRHEANKRIFRNCTAKLRNWAAWGSSKADLEWVWWDPRGTRRTPKWTKCDDLATADAMWNRMSPSSLRPRINNGPKTISSPFATGVLSPPYADRSVNTAIQGLTRTNISLHGGLGARTSAGCSTIPRLRRAKISEGFRSDTSYQVLPHINKALTSFPQFFFSQGSGCAPLSFVHYTQSFPHSFSMPCLSRPKRFPIHRGLRSSIALKTKNVGSEGVISDTYPAFCRSRKYQVWSARMGLQTLKCIGYSAHSLPTGPPGSPKTAFLGSLSLDSTVFERAYQNRQNPKWTSSSGISDLALCDGQQQYNTKRPIAVNRYNSDANALSEWRSLPLLRSHLTPFRRPTLLTWHEDSPGDQRDLVTRAGTQNKKPRHLMRKRSSMGRMPHFLIQAMDWSDWEVRLLYNLDRRLEWISNQLTPGQRPFHFALLANHWLNRETWIVYDPVSRITTDKRRRLGDPRFNVPYPAPTSTPTPKYPKSNRRPVHKPKINSWRLAVNRHRMESGLRPFIKGIELYDSSAEDPPDGKIDPASWILRRPPQGFSLSTRQREKHYEGGAGWQETLSDWQRISRGYRVRKGIYEGRVNRTRAKEIVYGITRYCRQVTSRFIQSDAIRCREECEELQTDEPS
ncbi:hypothetical protein BJX76DRAFT_347063 [Aspergillus varians]